jgi:hypothetical protein
VGEIEKEGDAENHDCNRDQAANCALQGDVAKTVVVSARRFASICLKAGLTAETVGASIGFVS